MQQVFYGNDKDPF